MKNIKETAKYVIVEFINNSGNKYEVGYPKDSGYTIKNIKGLLKNAKKKYQKSNSDDYKSITWIPNNTSTTTREAIKNGIVGGYVNKDDGWLYTYRLHFANHSGWIFYFKDLRGDTYSCTTPRNGNHYIDYNSNFPTIIGVY